MKLRFLFFIIVFFAPFFQFELVAEGYQYQLAICAIFRDDAAYLEEWIEFHRLLGVEHFFLYDNLSRDHFAEVLEPYIVDGIVDLISWNCEFPETDHQKWIAVQTGVYNDAIEKNRKICRWIAFIDTDEFLFPTFQDNLMSFLKDYEDFGGLCVCWRLFGTSHVSQINHGELMVEKLTFSADLDYHSYHKSIVKPDCVDHFEQAHSAVYFPPFFHVDARKERIESHALKSEASERSRDMIRINHYWTRDEDYFYNTKLVCRKRRGWLTDSDIKRANILNKHLDNSIFRFIPALRMRMEKSWERAYTRHS